MRSGVKVLNRSAVQGLVLNAETRRAQRSAEKASTENISSAFLRDLRVSALKLSSESKSKPWRIRHTRGVGDLRARGPVVSRGCARLRCDLRFQVWRLESRVLGRRGRRACLGWS